MTLEIDFTSRPEVVAATLVTEATTDTDYRALDRRLRKIYATHARLVRKARDSGDRELRAESERRRCFIADLMEEAQTIQLDAQEKRLRERDERDAAEVARKNAEAERAARLPDATKLFGSQQALLKQIDAAREHAAGMSGELVQMFEAKGRDTDALLAAVCGVLVRHVVGHLYAVNAAHAHLSARVRALESPQGGS